MRGGGFQSALAAQRQYSEGRKAVAKFGLMVPEAFVRGIRDLGYRSNGDAIAEFIDNSIQAYADRADILFGYDGGSSSKKPTQLAIIDNGHGMEPDMIRMAVMWGGTHRENDRVGLGRYGYGLPCASVSLGRRFTVYSQTSSSALHAVTLDLDDLTAGCYTDSTGEIIVPPPARTIIPDFVQAHLDAAYDTAWTNGTIVVVEKLDRLEWVTSQALKENLSRQFGVTYHKLRGQTAIYVDDAFVEPIDPLFLTAGFDLHDIDLDRANALDPIRFEVHDPETGEYNGAVTIRYAWLPPSFGSIDKERDAVGLNANRRFAILKDYHGVIFSRNGRLIDVQARTPWTTFINNDRYIKVEVEFSASLDEVFGVTTSKQQVSVSQQIWGALREAGLPKAIEQLRIKVRDAKLARRVAILTPRPGERLLSERSMSESHNRSRSSEFQFELGLTLAPYRLLYDNDPEGSFFRVDRYGGARTLHLNTAHRFYQDIYDGAVSTPEVRSALEVLLFSIGDIILDGDARSEAQNARQIREWSIRLDQALGMMATHLARSDDIDVGASF